MVDTSEGPPADRRLSSWKEIAAYFGRDERTVKRWEVVRGLPVRRVPRGTRSSVFAYQRELDNWLHGTDGGSDAEPAATAAGPAKPASRLAVLLAVAAVVVVLGLGTTVSLFDVFGTPLTEAPSHVPPPAAEVLYEQGVVDWNGRTSAGFERALGEFTKATELDPQFARAFAGLANVYNLISQYTDAPAADSYAKGKAAAEKAIALDPRLDEAYAALGFNAFYGSHEFARSAEMFEKAISLNPNSAQTLQWYALTSMHTGSFEKPLKLITQAQVLAPDSRAIAANKALILFHAGRTEDAITILNSLRQAHPDYLATPSYLASIYFALGRYEAFLDAYEQAATVSKNAAQLAIVAKARAGFVEGGGAAMLQAMLAEQQAQYQLGAEPAFSVAITAARLGDYATALDLLEASVSHGEPGAIAMRIEEAFVPLYADSRFRALLGRVGLPLPA